MEKVLSRFEKWISYVLMVSVMGYIVVQNLFLFYESIHSYVLRFSNSGLGYTKEYGKNIFVIFFNILLALEVLETVRVFNKSHNIKIRIILIVCLIAISKIRIQKQISVMYNKSKIRR